MPPEPASTRGPSAYRVAMSLGHIVLLSGRWIQLVELRISSTYGGMLAGYPCKRVNDRRISRLRQQAETAYPSMPVHLVQPTPEYPDRAPGRLGPVEVLPGVACVGLFDSAPLATAMDGSVLAAAWFQPAPEVPAGENADAALRAIPWEALAEDYEL